ncbi:hypothetical protein GCM10009555_044070 [Acrocarpospora macrocephala]|uniref:Uncharacterized protein n=1 Tax=Acrocarpospora macrocephala TaxID=150177 RepID=A0A5M3WF96_9ACTN|nr:hypothetical protein [Acrocarpospora macrocephala]GES06930.1 hypothetical protein Amac_005250 [Acrocarpospora macrocephala]
MTPISASPSDQLIFAPVGITHLTGDNADLIRAAAAGRSRIRLTTAAQLNGVPHFGTVVTMLTVFAFAQRTGEVLDLPVSIVFDALENAPAEHLTIDSEIYTRSVGDLIDTGHLDRAERVGGFEQLLTWAHRRSGITYEFRPYNVYQGLRPVRECLHHIASRLETFAPIVAPHDGIIRIRPRCPSCRLMQKSAKDLRITALSGAIRLDSRCPRHGPYAELVHIDGGGWYDANTPVRSVQKGYLLAAERDLYDACSVSVDGADWGGAWHAHVLAPALAHLGIPPTHWPVSIFTPLITDRTGGKLSKTLYVARGTYANLPELFLNLDVLLAQHGEQILDLIWAEVTRWAGEPRRLHRTYTVDYITALLEAGRPSEQLRTA